jgi:hypothetical protein
MGKKTKREKKGKNLREEKTLDSADIVRDGRFCPDRRWPILR